MNPTVTTSSGQVGGHPVGDGVTAFLGIPYAAPPIGPLRFAPPQPHPGWGGVREAATHGAAAPQALPGPGRPIVDLSVSAESEDCLTLSVWSPDPTPGTRLPVMVWVHGGAFVVGGSSVAAYDGARLAARGVVVVGINYRLGLAGWLRCLDAGASGNQALADQIAALEWVRAETEAFGGDPANVTVFGESAGGASIVSHLARGGDLPFDRAIIQSGAHNLCKAVDEAEDVALKVAADLGGDLASLATMPSAELQALQERVAPRSAGVLFGPVADGDLVPADPAAALAGGSAAGVDLLAGTNLDEMGFFWGRDDRFDEISDGFLAGMVGRWTGDAAAADTAIEGYRAARSARGAPVDNRALAMAMGADWTFRAPVAQVAGWQAEHARAWSYLFDWPSPLYDGLVGSAHTLELPFVFGTHDHSTCRGFTGGASPAADALAELMATTWVRFASGDGAAWDPYDTDRRPTQIFGAEPRVEHNPGGAELDLMFAHVSR
ncbi:MAG: carboxylesterase/lipase family protein [Acidimicrobiales bacterium]